MANDRSRQRTVPDDVTEAPDQVDPDDVLFVDTTLTDDDWTFWPDATKRVLWGWKRDVGDHSRTVYYSATLCAVGERIGATNQYFYYTHRTTEDAADRLKRAGSDAIAAFDERFETATAAIESTAVEGFDRVEFEVGTPDDGDRARLTALLDRTPRDSTDESRTIDRVPLDDVTDVFPADLYAGSGVSYECGLPTLRQVHDWFCLDNYEREVFTHGDLDTLPETLRSAPFDSFRQFCDLHIRALTADPSPAQRTIAALYDAGHIRQVFSDNVDNMLAKVDVPFERTRGSGVLNERHPASFETDTLLVVGVAADRRDLIQQARRAGMDVVVVDPIDDVSLGVKHLDFVRERDRFHETTADEFFRRAREQFDLSLERGRTVSERAG